jgi:hypothetical protein
MGQSYEEHRQHLKDKFCNEKDYFDEFYDVI